MSIITKEQMQEIIQNFGKNESDTGSSSVQIALLTKKINHLTDHLKIHRKDNHSRRGLLNMVEKRKKLQKYLSKTDKDQYAKVMKALGLRYNV